MQNRRVCVMGLGYIGLPTAALLATKGYLVRGVDIVESTVNTINQGKIHIVEPELDAFVSAAVGSGNLKAFTTPDLADIFIIAVPTPFHGDHIPNIEYVRSATRAIAPFVVEDNLIILESTSPVGTTEEISKTLSEEGVDVDSIFVAHCPERVLPGRVMIELVENDRIVGGLNSASTKKAAVFYHQFVNGEVLETDSRTAEMAKLTENSSRDVQIAFANELSILCDKFDIDVWELIRLANHHPRVNILSPGAGVGGHCIAVDPWFLVYSGGDQAKIIKCAREINDYKSEWVIEKIRNLALAFQQRHSRIATVVAMGLAFKPDIDDLRESPAVKIVRKLCNEESCEIFVVEPNISSSEEFNILQINEALDRADIVIFLVGHKQFKNLYVPEDLITFDFCGVRNEQ